MGFGKSHFGIFGKSNYILILLFLISSTHLAQAQGAWIQITTAFENPNISNNRIGGVATVGDIPCSIRSGKIIQQVYPGQYDIPIVLSISSDTIHRIDTLFRQIHIEHMDTTNLHIILSDSLVQSTDSLKYVKEKGLYYPMGKGLNAHDEKGRKQGLWRHFDHYIGNCLNYTTYGYDFFKDDTLILKVFIDLDANACYESMHSFSATIYDPVTGQPKLSLRSSYSSKLGKPPGHDQYLWDTVMSHNQYFFFGNEGDNSFIGIFIMENLFSNKSDKVFYFNNKILPGSYEKYSEGKPIKKYNRK